MAASKLDLVLEQGATFSLTITLNTSNGLPVDLTNYTAESYIKKTHADTDKLVAFSTDIPAPQTNGILILSLTNEQTSNLNFTTGVYDVNLISPDNKVSRILEGKVLYSLEVTK